MCGKDSQGFGLEFDAFMTHIEQKIKHKADASNVCLFSSYFKKETIPYYVKFYLQELTRFFDQVVMLTNDDRAIAAVDHEWLGSHGIDLMLVPNEGYDFGMWQKALPHFELARLKRLALINDSCILFAPLDDYFTWLDGGGADVSGMTESFERTPHLQSYFLVFQGPAIDKAAQYIQAHPVAGLDYQGVVDKFELGMSRMLYACGNLNVQPRYRIKGASRGGNPTYIYVSPLIRQGMPLIKKKVVSKEDAIPSLMKRIVREGFNPFPKHHIRVIREKHGLDSQLLDKLFADVLMSGRKNTKRFLRLFLRYKLMAMLGLLRPKG